MRFFLAITKKILKGIYPYVPFVFIRIVILRLCGYQIGKNVYMPSTLIISDLKTRRHNIIIGDRVDIGPGFTVITDSSPLNSNLKKIYPKESKNVTINNDAWLGANVTILPGVTIGEYAVIGTCSLVNKDIPPYSVAVGVPAKVINRIPKNEL